ncbi:YkgJ family cysteine cluster protein [Cupriavidus sp. HMR-1]|uniref:YkgJ family cysteine cluster protein n=1 Tax=Cupriavidus sp. HMR-1 TaxID=1249621 RepID=UPI0009DAD2C6|nr:YkgJ family cysteine cluster protein [Cupriavidus sp. HMR-1]
MASVPGEVNAPTSRAFPCTQCGRCCENVNLSDETLFLDRGDGTCRHYDAASKACSIYSERPDICRVDRMYVLRYARLHTWDEFIALNLHACDQLQSLARQ